MSCTTTRDYEAIRASTFLLQHCHSAGPLKDHSARLARGGRQCGRGSPWKKSGVRTGGATRHAPDAGCGDECTPSQVRDVSRAPNGASNGMIRARGSQHGPHIHNQCSPARTGGRTIISLAHSRVDNGQISTWRPPLLTAPLARKSLPETCWENILCASAPARRFARDGSISVAHRAPPHKTITCN